MKQFFYIVFGGLIILFLALIFNSVRLKIIQDSNHRMPTVKTDVINAAEEEGASVRTGDFWSLATSTIKARSYVLYDLDKNTMIKGKNFDTVMPVASLIKLLTAVVADNLIPKDREIHINNAILDIYGNAAGFRDGETLTRDDLMYPLLMVSSNDAAELLARSYGRTKFIKAMNDFAFEIGAYRTYVGDPTGLSALTVSTAHDIEILLDWMRINKPELLDITMQKMITIRNHTWVNPTHFLSWSYFSGGKNGYTPEANRTGALLFNIEVATSTTTPIANHASSTSTMMQRYAVVVLGSQARDSDVVSLLKNAVPQSTPVTHSR